MPRSVRDRCGRGLQRGDVGQPGQRGRPRCSAGPSWSRTTIRSIGWPGGQQERQADHGRRDGTGAGVGEGGPATTPPEQPQRQHHERHHRPRLHRDGQPEHHAGGGHPAPASTRRQQRQGREQPEVHQRLEQRRALGGAGRLPDGVEQPGREPGPRRDPTGDPPDEHGAHRAEAHERQPGGREADGVGGQPAQRRERGQHQRDPRRVQQQVVAVGQPAGEQGVGGRVVDAVVVGQDAAQTPAAQHRGEPRGEGDGGDRQGRGKAREPVGVPSAGWSHALVDDRHVRRVPPDAGQFLGRRRRRVVAPVSGS